MRRHGARGLFVVRHPEPCRVHCAWQLRWPRLQSVVPRGGALTGHLTAAPGERGEPAPAFARCRTARAAAAPAPAWLAYYRDHVRGQCKGSGSFVFGAGLSASSGWLVVGPPAEAAGPARAHPGGRPRGGLPGGPHFLRSKRFAQAHSARSPGEALRPTPSEPGLGGGQTGEGRDPPVTGA